MSEYKVYITLDKSFWQKKRSKEMVYFKNKDGKKFIDKVIFEKSLIIISGDRTKRINPDTFFDTTLSTAYKNMVKTLLYTYFTYGSFKIKNIRYSVDSSKGTIKNILQNFDITCPDSLKNKLNNECLETLFDNNGYSESLTKTLMYLILSFNDVQGENFFNIWKAFNVLLRQVTKEKNDFEMLKKMKDILEKNPNKFVESLKFANTEVDEAYLNKCSINAMIKNNHPKLKNKSKEANGVQDRIYNNYSDVRICKVLKGKLYCKKSVLMECNLYNNIEKSLERKIADNKKVDIDIIRFLILKYAYYLRCKFFHAEKMAVNFLYNNDDSSELVRISTPVLLLIIDILNSDMKF